MSCHMTNVVLGDHVMYHMMCHVTCQVTDHVMKHVTVLVTWVHMTGSRKYYRLPWQHTLQNNRTYQVGRTWCQTITQVQLLGIEHPRRLWNITRQHNHMSMVQWWASSHNLPWSDWVTRCQITWQFHLVPLSHFSKKSLVFLKTLIYHLNLPQYYHASHTLRPFGALTHAMNP